VLEGNEEEVIVVLDEECNPEASTLHLPQPPSMTLQDPAAWDIWERFLTTDLTYGQMEEDFGQYLGSRHCLLKWTEARLALFLGDGNDQASLANLLQLKHQHILPPATSTSKSGPH
jgi:hypothetical protein